MKEILYVGVGSCLGGIVRHLLSSAIRWDGHGLPWGTLAVNLLGCLLIGLFAGILSRHPSQALNLLLIVGLCGGFTTFSTFSRESLTLLQSSQYAALVTYILLSLIVGIALSATGYAITR